MALRKEIARLQYITVGATPDAVARETALFLDGGGRWVQLRMKEADKRTIVETASVILPKIHAAGGVLIIDDYPDIAVEAGADGVHLGRLDMPIAEARAIVGDLIIGATANTSDHVREAIEAGADYIGLGPFRYTTTKKNLSPTLGEEGYRDIVAQIGDSKIPTVAIGGITLDDIARIAETGVWGVAVAGAIAGADDPRKMTTEFLSLTKKYFR